MNAIMSNIEEQKISQNLDSINKKAQQMIIEKQFLPKKTIDLAVPCIIISNGITDNMKID